MTSVFAGEWRPVFFGNEAGRLVVGNTRRVIIDAESWYEASYLCCSPLRDGCGAILRWRTRELARRYVRLGL